VISPGEPFHLRDEPPAEWLQNWYLVRETGIVLSGPPAAAVVPPIAWSEFVAATSAYAASIAARPLDALGPGAVAYAVLTMCRAAMTVRTGRPASKHEAARWARNALPEAADAIDVALACRLSGGIEGFQDAASRAGAATTIAGLAALIGQGSA
jgi:hypothetical protein